MQVALHSSFLSSCITTMKPPLTAIRVTTINITPVHQIVTLLFISCLDHVPWEIVGFSTSFGMFTQGNRVSHPSPSVLSQPPSCQVVPRDRTRNGSGSDARGPCSVSPPGTVAGMPHDLGFCHVGKILQGHSSRTIVNH